MPSHLILMIALFSASVAVGACSTPPEPPAPLTPPSASLLQACGPLPNIPPNDGEWQARKDYYLASRRLYADCADRHRGLAHWARVASKP